MILSVIFRGPLGKKSSSEEVPCVFVCSRLARIPLDPGTDFVNYPELENAKGLLNFVVNLFTDWCTSFRTPPAAHTWKPSQAGFRNPKLPTKIVFKRCCQFCNCVKFSIVVPIILLSRSSVSLPHSTQAFGLSHDLFWTRGSTGFGIDAEHILPPRHFDVESLRLFSTWIKGVSKVQVSWWSSVIDFQLE